MAAKDTPSISEYPVLSYVLYFFHSLMYLFFTHLWNLTKYQALWKVPRKIVKTGLADAFKKCIGDCHLNWMRLCGWKKWWLRVSFGVKWIRIEIWHWHSISMTIEKIYIKSLSLILCLCKISVILLILRGSKCLLSN